MMQPSESEKSFLIQQVTTDSSDSVTDSLAVEEPMEIRIVFGPSERRTGRSLSITMRTPDHDFELATGFLFTEGIVQQRQQILGFEHCGDIADGRQRPNIVRVELDHELAIETQHLQRHFYTTSSCGICGKGSLEAIRRLGTSPMKDSIRVPRTSIFPLPERLRQEQRVFRQTGGIHAAGLFDLSGELILQREDVGRHNALDKLIGNRFLADVIPSNQNILLVSGRASFELVQKAIAAQIPIMVAVGAPSSLAVELAD